MEQITAGDGIDLLVAAGFAVQVKGSEDVEVAGRQARVLVRQTPPSPTSVAAELLRGRATIFVLPRMTAALKRLALENYRLAFVAVNDGIVVLDGVERLIPRHMAEHSVSRGSARRIAWGRYAIMRALARTSQPRTQMQLAAETGVTQAAVSQSLKRLSEYALKTSGGWAARDPEELAGTFLAQYPGAQGITRRWFSLDSATRQARIALDHGGESQALLSGDVGADRIAPWRSPGKAVIYAQTGLDLAAFGFAEADADHTSLEYIVPADPTIWATATAYNDGQRAEIADPLICAHDVLRTAGPDATEAIDKLIAKLRSEWRQR